MRCDEVENAIEALLDGRLDDAGREAVERHATSCAACWRALDEAREIEHRLRATFAAEAPPAGLWERIEADLGARTERRDLPRIPGSWRRFAAAAVLVVLMLGAGLYGLGLPPTTTLQAEVMEESAQELLTFIESRRPVDIASRDPDAIQGWMRGKVDFDPPRPPVTQGLELIGARLCYFLDRRIAAYMYEADGALLSLYVMRSEGLQAPKGDLVTLAGADAAIGEASGLTSMIWHERGLAFALISEFSRARLISAAEDLARST